MNGGGNVTPIILPDRVDVCPLAPAVMCPNHVGETLPCFLFGRGIECVRPDHVMCVKCGQALQYQHGDGRTDWIVVYQATNCDHKTRAEQDQDPSVSLTGPAST